MPTLRLARRAATLVLVPLVLATLQVEAPAQTVRPWFYRDDGMPLWERHQFAEGNSNAVFALAFELATVPGQDVPRPDVLLLNGPHYDPPEGVPAAPGTRRFLGSSVQDRALRLYINYGGVPLGSSHYLQPTFFISDLANAEQSQPPALDVFPSPLLIAPTRAALGNVGTPDLHHQRFPLLHEVTSETPAPPLNALYVTAGVGVALAEFDAASQSEVMEAIKDRLFLRQSDQTWLDRSDLVPESVREGNSSGACFADFNGDGYMDLFVGKPGDNYAGEKSCLLFYDPGMENFADETGSMPQYPAAATVDVVAADLDGDDDQDIVVANRARRGGAIGAESLDYAFVNDGSGRFTRLDLAPGVYSDSRSVAVGELDDVEPEAVPAPEVVLGNGGADGFCNALDISASDHPLQIFSDDAAPGLNLQDKLTDFIPSGEAELSRPFTWQVVIADLFGPGLLDFMPDGAADLLLVNHRDILLDWSPTPLGLRDASNVRFLVNQPGTRVLLDKGRQDAAWATTVVLGNFSDNDGEGTLDLFVGTGNSFSGSDPVYLENSGSDWPDELQWPPWTVSTSYGAGHLTYDAMPGNERGYGFDFADFNGNGYLDALQTARGYDYLVTDLTVEASGHEDGDRHWNLTRHSSPVDFSNKRGQLAPPGAEDAVFADFDGDGVMDALLASQIGSNLTGDTVLLQGVGGPGTGFVHETNLDNGFPFDRYIDLMTRSGGRRPSIADRAYAVDLDNDSDEDAWVHLFGLPNDNPPGSAPATPMLGVGGVPNDPEHMSVGWRLLVNVTTSPDAPPPWFHDVAAQRLHDGSSGGGFSIYWNRTLGFDVLADFDNNGACDFFTVIGGPQRQGNPYDVSDLRQGHDLLFMNKYGGAPVGEFVEVSLRNPAPFPQREMPAANPPWTAGSSGLAQGDVDNDGDADLFVSCGIREVGGQVFDKHFSELLINNGQSGTAFGFTDEFSSRVPTAVGLVSTKIHSKKFSKDETLVHDDAGVPLLVDLDADGDLDLIYAVGRNIPRFYRNRGQDSNQDGFITSVDSPPPGTFEDCTDTWVSRIRPMTDTVDAAAVDIDRDGDLDPIFDCFSDEVVPMRNEVAQQGARPAITEAWPRVGCIRSRKVVLEGVNLWDAAGVQFISRASGTSVLIRPPNITNETHGRISFTLPTSVPLGLAQIRVKRANPPTPADTWSRQYFAYFVLGS